MRYVYDAWGKVKIQRELSDVGLATANPFLWRGYIYDYDTGLYYLRSRYYDPELCRFLNPDDPAILLLEDSIPPNVYAYCHNDPVNDKDIFGCLSAKKLAEKLSITSIFGLFAPMLFANYAQGLIAVGTYTTKLITPIAAKAFWWKPWLIVAIVVAAVAIVVAGVAIVVAGVAIYFSKKSKQSAKERAKDAPSWLADVMNALPPHWGEKAKDYAKRLLDQKYGKGNWKTGPNSEYNKIVKYLVRHVGMS